MSGMIGRKAALTGGFLGVGGGGGGGGVAAPPGRGA